MTVYPTAIDDSRRCCRCVRVEDEGDDNDLDDDPGDDVGVDDGATRTWIESCSPFLFRRSRLCSLQLGMILSKVNTLRKSGIPCL